MLNIYKAGEEYFTNEEAAREIFEKITGLLKTHQPTRKLVMVGSYSIYMLMEINEMPSIAKVTKDIDGKICLSEKDDIATEKEKTMKFLSDNGIYVSTDESKKGDKNTPIKIYSKGDIGPDGKYRIGNFVIDLSFSVNDARCVDSFEYKNMNISSAISTFHHYEEIFDKLKRDGSYNDKLIKVMGENNLRKPMWMPRWMHIIQTFQKIKKLEKKKPLNQDDFKVFL